MAQFAVMEIGALPVQCFIKIMPLRIDALDQIDLPLSIPLLDVFLSLNSVENVVVFLIPDKPLHRVFGSETATLPFTVIIYPALEIRCDPGIDCAALSAGQHVNIPTHIPLALRNGSSGQARG